MSRIDQDYARIESISRLAAKSFKKTAPLLEKTQNYKNAVEEGLRLAKDDKREASKFFTKSRKILEKYPTFYDTIFSIYSKSPEFNWIIKDLSDTILPKINLKKRREFLRRMPEIIETHAELGKWLIRNPEIVVESNPQLIKKMKEFNEKVYDPTALDSHHTSTGEITGTWEEKRGVISSAKNIFRYAPIDYAEKTINRILELSKKDGKIAYNLINNLDWLMRDETRETNQDFLDRLFQKMDENDFSKISNGSGPLKSLKKAPQKFQKLFDDEKKLNVKNRFAADAFSRMSYDLLEQHPEEYEIIFQHGLEISFKNNLRSYSFFNSMGNLVCGTDAFEKELSVEKIIKDEAAFVSDTGKKGHSNFFNTFNPIMLNHPQAYDKTIAQVREIIQENLEIYEKVISYRGFSINEDIEKHDGFLLECVTEVCDRLDAEKVQKLIENIESSLEIEPKYSQGIKKIILKSVQKYDPKDHYFDFESYDNTSFLNKKTWTKFSEMSEKYKKRSLNIVECLTEDYMFAEASTLIFWNEEIRKKAGRDYERLIRTIEEGKHAIASVVYTLSEKISKIPEKYKDDVLEDIEKIVKKDRELADVFVRDIGQIFPTHDYETDKNLYLLLKVKDQKFANSVSSLISDEFREMYSRKVGGFY